MTKLTDHLLLFKTASRTLRILAWRTIVGRRTETEIFNTNPGQCKIRRHFVSELLFSHRLA